MTTINGKTIDEINDMIAEVVEEARTQRVEDEYQMLVDEENAYWDMMATQYDERGYLYE
jgi:hypothetical protein